MKKLRLGFSTCPNDTFIFDAMVHHKVDTEGLEFDYFLADVEELNKISFEGNIDITKISFHAYAYIADKFKILEPGSALGRNNGPLLISKRKIYPDEVPFVKIAIPGRNTTANLLLHIAYPDVKDLHEYLFSDIEEAVLTDEVDAGLIIHESRFTYEKKGLRKVVDLGEYWEETTGLPVPLGGIIINRNLDEETMHKVNRVLRRSIDYAYANPSESYEFIKKYAQEMEEDVMYKHIELYVNEYTLALGNDGRDAIRYLYQKGHEVGLIPEVREDIFV